MKIINLEASAWRTPDDFYSALLPQLGAPDWHGRNLNALEDSLYGGINNLQPPFRVVIAGTNGIGSDLQGFLAQVIEVFLCARTQYGADVEIELG
jgi:RNAse (barnase) inhibitor barstar